MTTNNYIKLHLHMAIISNVQSDMVLHTYISYIYRLEYSLYIYIFMYIHICVYTFIHVHIGVF